MLFVLSQGRSGTAFLAELLDGAPGARVHHEAWPGDAQILGLARYGRSRAAVEALLEERFAELLAAAGDVRLYGEVNSYLRYSAGWLRRRFDPVLVHLVRDGRDFVRSAWPRDVQTPQQRQLPIVPTDDDPWADRWPRFDRFERICWIWDHSNRVLADQVEHRVRLEDLVADYAVFRRALLEPAGLEVSETAWRAAVARPRNTSSEFRLRGLVRAVLGRGSAGREALPPWSQWSDRQTGAFWSICGETMERLGYGSRGAEASPPISTEVREGQR